MSTFISNLHDLVKSSLNIVKLYDSVFIRPKLPDDDDDDNRTDEEISEFNLVSKIEQSVVSFNMLLDTLKKTGKTGKKIKTLIEELTESLYQDLEENIVVVIGDKNELKLKWIKPELTDQRNSDGYRKIVIYPSKNSKGISLPLSEIYDMSSKLFRDDPEKYGVLPAKLLNSVLTTFSSSIDEDNDNIDTMGMTESCVSLSSMYDLSEGLDGNFLEEITTKLFGESGMGEGVTKMVKGGGLESVISKATSGIGAILEDDTLKSEFANIQGVIGGEGGGMEALMQSGKNIIDKLAEKNIAEEDNDALPICDQD